MDLNLSAGMIARLPKTSYQDFERSKTQKIWMLKGVSYGIQT